MVHDDPESFADLDGHQEADPEIEREPDEKENEEFESARNRAGSAVAASQAPSPAALSPEMVDEIRTKGYEDPITKECYAPNPNFGRTTIGPSEGSNAKTYQTYTKDNPGSGEVYSGRTGGTGTPEENVAARDSNHKMNDKGFGPAKLDKSSPNKDAIRGREQQLIKNNGGAKSQGGTSGNAINGVSPKNPNAQKYDDAAKKEFDNPPQN